MDPKIESNLRERHALTQEQSKIEKKLYLLKQKQAKIQTQIDEIDRSNAQQLNLLE